MSSLDKELVPQPLICPNCTGQISFKYVQSYWVGYLSSTRSEKKAEQSRINGAKNTNFRNKKDKSLNA